MKRNHRNLKVTVPLTIDFLLLRKQKEWLLTQKSDHATAILHVIDAIQDHAVDTGLASDRQVFGSGYRAPDKVKVAKR